jgi:hypothetical protein
LRPQQFYLVATSQKVGDHKDLAFGRALLVQPCWVIPREHLLVWTRAPLQWPNVVVKKRVHHVVGNEVEVQRFWILSTTASKQVVLAGEV